ncbi:MAG: peptidoglycan bridge formation glycyltransferase FemA/FemB family protein [Patescibacteria group bacterium]
MDRQNWNQFVIEHGPRSGSFLQSWGWTHFQKKVGKEVEEVKIGKVGVATLIHTKIGLWDYWYCPRGPVVIEGQLASAMDHLSRQFSQSTFLRLDFPILISQLSSYPVTQLPNYKLSPHPIQPPTTLILDLTLSEESLLAQMHEKTRYNIRVSERHGIEVSAGDVEEFLALMRETATRDSFRAHPDEYYRTMLAEHGDPDVNISLVVARHEGKAVAVAIICDFANTRTYLHGASSYEYRNLMAPYALHWELIKEARVKGFLVYDFWGIAGSDNSHEPLAGVTRFKKGWGGEIVRYAPTLDLVLKPWHYRVYRLIHWLRGL